MFVLQDVLSLLPLQSYITGLVHLQGPLGQLWSQVPWDSPSGRGLYELRRYPNSPFAFKERTLSLLRVGAGTRRSWCGSECAAKMPVLCGCASDGRAL